MKSMSLVTTTGLVMTGLALIAGWQHFIAQSDAQGPATCTPASTPNQCYTAGLTQIAEARSQMESLRSDLGARVAQLETKVTELERVSRLAAPAGRVVAFDLQACPEGWSKYTQAIDRFVRGIDPESGGRTLGSTQEDSFQGHTFGDGSGKFFCVS